MSRLDPRWPIRRARHFRRMRGEARLQRRLAGPRLLKAFAATVSTPFFVEIGSNDGEQHDHLRPFILERSWRGIMVEPVPYIFERLAVNYRDVGDRVALENAAIADRDGVLPFFHLVSPAQEELSWLPDWYDGIGSFSREAVASHRDSIPDIEDRIVRAEVPCLTFDTLLARHGNASVDLIVIDTEGYDYQLLTSIDFHRHRPRLVVYEHFHLSPEDRVAARSHMEDAGFATMEEGFDTWCVRPQPEDALSRAWKDARPAIPGVSTHEKEELRGA